MNKNRNEAIGNYAIYQLDLFEELHKIGKADAERITKSSGLPTRIHQQVRKLTKKHGEDDVEHAILEVMKNISTKEAKNREEEVLLN